MSHRERLTCLRCGYEGYDVKPTLVRYDDPLPVTVQVPVSSRENAVTESREVPGIYGAEWRCVDRPACDRRFNELEPAVPDEVGVAEFFAEVEPSAPTSAPVARDEELAAWT